MQLHTVRPLKSGHPPFEWLVFKRPDLFVSKLLYLIPLFNGHLCLATAATFLLSQVNYLCLFTSINRPANYLS